MKRNILLIVFCMFTISLANAQTQYKVTFGYDSAGNQTVRDRVCVNCASAKTRIDSTTVAAEDIDEKKLEDDEQDKEDLGITAYPNPVSDILTVEWLETEHEVEQIILLSAANVQLANKSIKPGRQSIELSFGRYPPGMYVVLLIYGDNTKQSFQVIKK